MHVHNTQTPTQDIWNLYLGSSNEKKTDRTKFIFQKLRPLKHCWGSYCFLVSTVSCLQAGYPSKCDSEMLKTRFKKCIAFVHIVYCQNAWSKPSFNKVRFACHTMSYLAFHINFGRITRFVLHIVVCCVTHMNGRWPSFLIRHSGVFQMNNLAFDGGC